MSIVVVIGLPCSGKSHLLKDFEKEGFIIHDDFISQFYNGKLLQDLLVNINTHKVCVADPRLCMLPIFTKFIEQIKEITSDIHLILYENNPSACLNNLKNRDDGLRRLTHTHKKGIDNNIREFSNKYDLTNYKNYSHEIIPVYFELL